jgi:hypothetical protein
MPVQVVWDDEAQTVVRQIYEGHTILDDYISATDEVARLAKTVPHTIHSVMDRTRIVRTPGSMLPAMRYANQHVPPNLGLRIVLKASMFTRIIVDVGRRVAPHLVQNLFFVETLDEARALIEKHRSDQSKPSEPAQAN